MTLLSRAAQLSRDLKELGFFTSQGDGFKIKPTSDGYNIILRYHPAHGTLENTDLEFITWAIEKEFLDCTVEHTKNLFDEWKISMSAF